MSGLNSKLVGFYKVNNFLFTPVQYIGDQIPKRRRESSSLLNKIKKDKQQDHPDNGLKSIRFTGPGQDFGNAATAASKVYIMIS